MPFVFLCLILCQSCANDTPLHVHTPVLVSTVDPFVLQWIIPIDCKQMPLTETPFFLQVIRLNSLVHHELQN